MRNGPGKHSVRSRNSCRRAKVMALAIREDDRLCPSSTRREFGASGLRPQLRAQVSSAEVIWTLKVKEQSWSHAFLGSEDSSEVVSVVHTMRAIFSRERGRGDRQQKIALEFMKRLQSGLCSKNQGRFWRDVVGCRGGPVWRPRSRLSLVATSHLRVRQMLALAASFFLGGASELRRWVGPGLAVARHPCRLSHPPVLSSFRPS